MRINMSQDDEQDISGNSYQLKKRIYLGSEALLRYLIGNDEKLETLVICKNSECILETDDHALYEAMGSIKQYDDFKLPKLVKLFEVVRIISGKRVGKGILTDGRVEELRKEALRQFEVETKNQKKDQKDDNQKNI